MQTRLNKSAKMNIGIGIVEEKKRYYPGETLASHILGYTNKEGKAALGLELKLDDTLKGVPGNLSYEKTAKAWNCRMQKLILNLQKTAIMCVSPLIRTFNSTWKRAGQSK